MVSILIVIISQYTCTDMVYVCMFFRLGTNIYKLDLIKHLRSFSTTSLRWRHNEHDGVSNHQPHDCLFNRLFKAEIKENIKALRLWPLWGEFTGDRWIPAQRASNAENVSIWWRHHGMCVYVLYVVCCVALLYKCMCLKCFSIEINLILLERETYYWYVLQWNASRLFRIMACCLVGAKPLSKPIFTYWRLHHKEQWNYL